jgi:hypothetical protein
MASSSGEAATSAESQLLAEGLAPRGDQRHQLTLVLHASEAQEAQ